jgi:tubulin polyglutamylase TTLL2
MLTEKGLTRFATSRYDIGDESLKNVFSHLTNTSINKYSPTLETNKEEIGSGCRWKINRLRKYFEKRDINFEKIWNRIKSIIILTLLPVAPEVDQKGHTSGCFELYGFDILIDENLKPWLLEVNLSPQLNVDSQTDIDVKKPLLEDMLELIKIEQTMATNARLHYEELEKNKAKRKKSIKVPIIERHIKSTSSIALTDKSFPASVGQWNKIYPFDDESSRQSAPVKVGSPAMKNIVSNLRKHFA